MTNDFKLISFTNCRPVDLLNTVYPNSRIANRFEIQVAPIQCVINVQYLKIWPKLEFN